MVGMARMARTGPQLRYEVLSKAHMMSSVQRISGSRERWRIRIDYDGLPFGRREIFMHDNWLDGLVPAAEVASRIITALPGAALVRADLKMIDRRMPRDLNERWGEWVTHKGFPVYEIVIEYPPDATRARKDLRGSYAWQALNANQRQGMIRYARAHYRENTAALTGEIANARVALRRCLDAPDNLRAAQDAFITRLDLIGHRLWQMREEMADPAFARAYRASLSDLARAYRDARLALRTIQSHPRLRRGYDRQTFRTMNALLDVIERAARITPMIETIPLPEM